MLSTKEIVLNQGAVTRLPPATHGESALLAVDGFMGPVVGW